MTGCMEKLGKLGRKTPLSRLPSLPADRYRTVTCNAAVGSRTGRYGLVAAHGAPPTFTPGSPDLTSPRRPAMGWSQPSGLNPDYGCLGGLEDSLVEPFWAAGATGDAHAPGPSTSRDIGPADHRRSMPCSRTTSHRQMRMEEGCTCPARRCILTVSAKRNPCRRGRDLQRLRKRPKSPPCH